MSLTRLDINEFRNLTSVKLNLLPAGINLFYGSNGSGKTSLIESVYYLINGRSFRTATAQNLINTNAVAFSLFAHISNRYTQTSVPIGVAKNRTGKIKLRVAGEDRQSFTILAQATPVLLLHAGAHQLLDAGPAFRRKYLDWGAFYQATSFLQIWKQYARALRQRNVLLRQRKGGKELASWTAELVKSGMVLDSARRAFVAQLLPHLSEALLALLALPDVTLDYYPGWDAENSLQQALEQALAKDMQLGATSVGPHRADFNIKINQIAARERLSRGQQKLFFCAMLVAQGALLQQQYKQPIYLVDDLSAELDSTSQLKLLALLVKQQAQIFLTAIDTTQLAKAIPDSVAMQMFHVEHGVIKCNYSAETAFCRKRPDLSQGFAKN